MNELNELMRVLRVLRLYGLNRAGAFFGRAGVVVVLL